MLTIPHLRHLSTAIAVALTTLFAAPASAQKEPPRSVKSAPPTKATPACQGRDMLADLATSNPAAHASIMAKGAAVSNATARLWKIEKAGITQPSHLMGTIHLTDDRLVALSPAVEQALSSSKVLAVEIAGLADDKRMDKAMQAAGNQMVFTDGRDLSAVLTPAELAAVGEVTASSGMPPDAARMLRPWVVSMLLAASACERDRMTSGAKILDERLEEFAKSKRIKVVGLETVKEQIGAMAKMPEVDQVQHLRASLVYRNRLDDTTATLVNLYLSRNLGAAMPLQQHLAEMANVGKVSFETFEKLLLTDRNIHMRDRSKPLVDKGGAFIAVGALHLSGPQGLVALFREAGYTVTPIAD